MNRTCACLDRRCDDHLSVEQYEGLLNRWKQVASRWERLAWQGLIGAAAAITIAALYATGVWHA